MHVPKWSLDENYFGSYSFLSKGALDGSVASWADLFEPVDKLYFVGEAMDERYSGYIQGALRSAERVASELLRKMNLA